MNECETNGASTATTGNTTLHVPEATILFYHCRKVKLMDWMDGSQVRSQDFQNFHGKAGLL